MPNEIFRAVTGLDIEIGDRTLHAKPLPWRSAIEILGIIHADKQAQVPYGQTLEKIMARLPQAVGLKPEDFEELDYADLDELIARFFHLRKNGRTETIGSASTFLADSVPSTSTT